MHEYITSESLSPSSLPRDRRPEHPYSKPSLCDRLDAFFRPATRVTWLVPTWSNDGRKFPAAYFVEMEQHVQAVVGALSRREGVVAGQWTFEGRTYGDFSREYFIDVPEQRLAQELGVAIYQFAAIRFGQHALSIELSLITTTVFTPKEEIMNLPSKFSWQPVAIDRPERGLLTSLRLIASLVLARCNVALRLSKNQLLERRGL